MSSRAVSTPSSRIRFGYARADITPPAGIYHHLWGASRTFQSTGIHRPLYADVMVLGSLEGRAAPFVRVELDLCVLGPLYNDLVHAVNQGSGVPVDNIAITCSHTHGAGWLVEPEGNPPGADLVGPYFRELVLNVGDASRRAYSNVQEVTITYSAGKCNLARNRDYWDAIKGAYVCGFNPGSPADDTLIVGRVETPQGSTVGTVVNYGCHPTTLAWQNTLISPDFVGAAREVVEKATGAPCIYLQGACGELGPQNGFVGDKEVADRNGRQLGYAALSTMQSIAPASFDFQYSGPVESGALLGAWAYSPFAKEHLDRAAQFQAGSYIVDLPVRDLPDLAQLQKNRADWEARRLEAEKRGDLNAARDAGAHEERAKRWIGRLERLPDRKVYKYRYTLCRMGDAVWVTVEGEPYSYIQTELRHRFPHLTIVFSPLEGGGSVAYLPTAETYGKQIYQEMIATVAAGGLETVTDTIALKIDAIAPLKSSKDRGWLE